MPAFTISEIVAASGGITQAQPDLVCADVVTDSRQDCSGKLFIPIRGEQFDGHAFLEQIAASGALATLANDDAVISESILQRLIVIRVPDTTTAYQRLANFHRRRFPNLKIAAVTGSSGKTSTKEMLRAIFSQAFGPDAVLATEGNTNNQIGVPQNLMRLNRGHRAAVIEMGTNHHGEIRPLSLCAEPHTAVINFIGSCHLEHLGSLDGVGTEKSAIFAGLDSDGYAVIPVSGNAQQILEEAAAPFNILHFGSEKNADVSCKYLGGHLQGSAFELNIAGSIRRIDWKLSGAHQAMNAAAAAAAALSFNISPDDIATGLPNCSLPGMRMRISRSSNNVTWINDAYNANPDSMRASLQWLAEFSPQHQTVLVLGDMREIGSDSIDQQRQILELARKLFPASKIFAVGPDMSAAVSAMPPQLRENFLSASDSAAAAPMVKAAVMPGDHVFLKASRGIKLEIVETAANT